MVVDWLTDGNAAQPGVESQRCVHAIAECAECRVCVETCPRDAWILDDAALALDTAACDGCGLCRPACPQAAIRLDVRAAVRDDGDGPAAFAACPQSGLAAATGAVPCIHALGLRDLLQLYRRGVTRFFVARGQCATCPRGPRQGLDLALRELNAWLVAGARRPFVLAELEPEAWRRRLDRSRPARGPAVSRRGLLRNLVAGAPQPAAAQSGPDGQAAREAPGRLLPQRRQDDPLPHVPVIATESCVGCDACARLCPEAAITLQGTGRARSYTIQAENCTGCRICADVCEVGAVEILSWSVPKQSSVPLDQARCRACGVAFHAPAGRRAMHGMCRVCSETGRQSRLYQVLD